MVMINDAEQVRTYKAVGVMSGTSLDGIDLVLCKFKFDTKTWSFTI